MEFEFSDRCKEYQEKLLAFMDEQVYPAESTTPRRWPTSGDPTSTRQSSKS